MTLLVISIAVVFSFTTVSTVIGANAPTQEDAQRLRAILDAPLPDPKQHSRPQLAQLYVQRGKAASELGDSERAITEFTAGLGVVGPKNPASYDLHHELAGIHHDRGEHRRGVEARKAALAVARTLPRQLAQVSLITLTLSAMRQREEARQFVTRAEALLGGARGHPGWSNNGDLWTGRVAMASGRFNETFGYLKEAEENFRVCTASLRVHLRNNPSAARNTLFSLAYCTRRWIEVALRQGRLREASAFTDDLRQLAQDFADITGRPLFVSRMAPTTAHVYIEQGLVNQGKTLLEKTIAHYDEEVLNEEDLTERSSPAVSRRLLATIEMLGQNWQKAEEIFRQSKEPVPLWAYTLLRQNRAKDALDMMNSILDESGQHYDEKSLTLWEHRAFHALAVGASGRREEAVKTLSRTLPTILEMSRPDGTSGEAGLLNTTRLNWLLDGYITLLTDIHKSGGRVDGIDLISEAFRYSDIARGSRVQGALSAAIVRASVSDPALAAVVRRSQDLEYQVKATAEYLAALQSDQGDPEKEKLITAKRAELEHLRTENEQAQQELKRKLPDYSELLSPRPLDIAGVQKFLRANEALIATYSMPQRTLIWAISAQGTVSFTVLDVSNTAIAEIVTKLRKSLDPTAVDIRQSPTFDFAMAHDLYSKLLAPVEAGWRSAQELLIVPHGRLSELPFSVLVTGSYQPAGTGVLFANHADAPWLIKQAAISYLPSVAGLAALRRTTTRPAERGFIGFGDPVFVASKSSAVAAEVVARGIDRETLRSTTSSGGDTRRASTQFESLPPLPDTAQEVREIAKILQADDSRDIYLGSKASEKTVKAAELAKYRTVMFATHGLVPGDLTDLAQPALALSNPKLVQENEDGLLTLTEILGLKLQADWVVLSACNTASADGEAAEAVSGLGRAFFFAGAKALLVSHWPVETVSARLLTTELFKVQTANPKLGRAKAMREASLAVMRQSATARGRTYSYAHPMFWAPFVVVGDGG